MLSINVSSANLANNVQYFLLTEKNVNCLGRLQRLRSNDEQGSLGNFPDKQKTPAPSIKPN